MIEFLREENRVLRAQLHGRRMRLRDDERRWLAVLGQRLGRRMLAHVASIVTPDTILRWHRELVARKWTYAARRPGRPGVQAEIRRLVVRMATENPSWGYTRIQGALKNLGHRVVRSTVSRVLREQSIPPSRERPMTWRTFLRAHWPALLAADFFTTEVWTVRGLVTCYTLIRLVKPRIVVPNHHDETGGSFPDLATEPLFMAIRDELPGTRTYSLLYRSPMCINVSTGQVFVGPGEAGPTRRR